MKNPAVILASAYCPNVYKYSAKYSMQCLLVIVEKEELLLCIREIKWN